MYKIFAFAIALTLFSACGDTAKETGTTPTDAEVTVPNGAVTDPATTPATASAADVATGAAAVPSSVTSGKVDVAAAPSTGAAASSSTVPMPATPATPAVVGKTTKVKFDKMSHDFGTIKDGASVTHEFAFTNSGTEPLVISNAKGSCGCTVPEWPKDPIAPGASSKLKVTYNSKGKGEKGGKKDNKTVTITANTDPSPVVLRIAANVEKDE